MASSQLYSKVPKLLGIIDDYKTRIDQQNTHLSVNKQPPIDKKYIDSAEHALRESYGRLGHERDAVHYFRSVRHLFAHYSLGEEAGTLKGVEDITPETKDPEFGYRVAVAKAVLDRIISPPIYMGVAARDAVEKLKEGKAIYDIWQIAGDVRQSSSVAIAREKASSIQRARYELPDLETRLADTKYNLDKVQTQLTEEQSKLKYLGATPLIKKGLFGRKNQSSKQKEFAEAENIINDMQNQINFLDGQINIYSQEIEKARKEASYQFHPTVNDALALARLDMLYTYDPSLQRMAVELENLGNISDLKSPDELGRLKTTLDGTYRELLHAYRTSGRQVASDKNKALQTLEKAKENLYEAIEGPKIRAEEERKRKQQEEDAVRENLKEVAKSFLPKGNQTVHLLLAFGIVGGILSLFSFVFNSTTAYAILPNLSPSKIVSIPLLLLLSGGFLFYLFKKHNQ